MPDQHPQPQSHCNTKRHNTSETPIRTRHNKLLLTRDLDSVVTGGHWEPGFLSFTPSLRSFSLVIVRFTKNSGESRPVLRLCLHLDLENRERFRKLKRIESTAFPNGKGQKRGGWGIERNDTRAEGGMIGGELSRGMSWESYEGEERELGFPGAEERFAREWNGWILRCVMLIDIIRQEISFSVVVGQAGTTVGVWSDKCCNRFGPFLAMVSSSVRGRWCRTFLCFLLSDLD